VLAKLCEGMVGAGSGATDAVLTRMRGISTPDEQVASLESAGIIVIIIIIIIIHIKAVACHDAEAASVRCGIRVGADADVAYHASRRCRICRMMFGADGDAVLGGRRTAR